MVAWLQLFFMSAMSQQTREDTTYICLCALATDIQEACYIFKRVRDLLQQVNTFDQTQVVSAQD